MDSPIPAKMPSSHPEAPDSGDLVKMVVRSFLHSIKIQRLRPSFMREPKGENPPEAVETHIAALSDSEGGSAGNLKHLQAMLELQPHLPTMSKNQLSALERVLQSLL